MGGRRAHPSVRAGPVVVRPQRHRCQPVGPAPGPAGHRAARRSWSSPTATTAAWTRPSWSAGRTAPRVAAGQRRRRPWTRRDDHAWPSSSTTSTRRARLCAPGDIAAVLTEPALTNIGIVLPEPGFHTGLRALCDETGTLLMIDETHTLPPGRAVHRGVGTRPGHRDHRQGDRRWDADRRLRPRADLAAAARRSRTTAPTSSTWAASAARWPATPCRWPRCGPRSSDVLTDEAFAGWRLWPCVWPSRCEAPSPATGCPGRSRGSGPGPSTGSARPRPERERVDRGRGLGTRRVPPPLHVQPRRTHHPLPQHGPDVPGHDRRPTSTATARSSRGPWPPGRLTEPASATRAVSPRIASVRAPMAAERPTIVATSGGIRTGTRTDVSSRPSSTTPSSCPGCPGAKPGSVTWARPVGTNGGGMRSLDEAGRVRRDRGGAPQPLPDAGHRRSAGCCSTGRGLGGRGKCGEPPSLWRLHGLDDVFAEVWRAGVVLGGVSAGSRSRWHVGGTDPNWSDPIWRPSRTASPCPPSRGVDYDSEPHAVRCSSDSSPTGRCPTGPPTDDGVGRVPRHRPGGAVTRSGARRPTPSGAGDTAVEDHIEPLVLPARRAGRHERDRVGVPADVLGLGSEPPSPAPVRRSPMSFISKTT